MFKYLYESKSSDKVCFAFPCAKTNLIRIIDNEYWNVGYTLYSLSPCLLRNLNLLDHVRMKTGMTNFWRKIILWTLCTYYTYRYCKMNVSETTSQGQLMLDLFFFEHLLCSLVHMIPICEWIVNFVLSFWFLQITL